jgi:hypothetical protein
LQRGNFTAKAHPECSRLHAAKDIAKAGLPLESAAHLLNDAEYAVVFGKTS